MAGHVLQLLEAKLPALFAQAVSELERRAGGGDESARRRLVELDAPAHALIRLSGEGQGDLHLESERRRLAIGAGSTAPGAFGHALALPSAAARHGLGQLGEGNPDVVRLVSAWATLVSPGARTVLAGMSYAFDVEVLRVPVIGDLRATISLGCASLPASVDFRVTIDYDELEDAREQQLGPQQLFLAGKVRIDGDVAKAMMLGMTLAQLR
jgi:SCP-2 sterol transfer family